MFKLAPHLPFDPIETPLGYAVRLAAVHTGGPIGPFLRDIGVSLPDLARGQSAAIGMLSDHAGVKRSALMANAAEAVGRQSFHLRGTEVSVDFLHTSGTVFCPACLRDDDIASGVDRSFAAIAGSGSCA